MIFWNKYHGEYLTFQKQSISVEHFFQGIVESVKIDSNDKILDVGCGNGSLLEKIEKYSVNTSGLDFSNEAIQLAKLRTNHANYILHDLTRELPLKDAFFDKIYCINTLYSLGEVGMKRTLAELFRVLKKNGILVISDPKPFFSNISIFNYDVKQTVLTKGIKYGILYTIKNFILYVKLFYYNILIDRRAKKGQYCYFDSDEYQEKIKNWGFQIIKISTAYNKQNNFVVARKP